MKTAEQWQRELAGETSLQAIFLYQAGKRRKRLQPSLEGVEYYRRAQPARVSKIAAIFKLPK